ncbi:MAG: glutamate--cysteine ligase [Deltaproteobacteria bacterium]|nr:glutamate--cysteine ligase [Deltaproteobacteria bacterium]
MSQVAKIRKFSAYGIELEYMLVKKGDHSIAPIADEVLTSLEGELTEEFERNGTAWSQELALHVIELKTNGPQDSFLDIQRAFVKEIREMNKLLEHFDCCLMPTAMHPFMHPDEVKLWPHGYREIFLAYDRIFNCKGHGWSNLQSVHINLPFFDDQEFARVHSAVRLVLPLIAPLAASSPFVESKLTGRLDNRLDFYLQNQRKIPSITGDLIPEPVTSRKTYEDVILKRLYTDIAPFDPGKILQKEWLNSRGAIARFDRNAIEVRVMDIQESVKMDFAITTAIISMLILLEKDQWGPLSQWEHFDTLELRHILQTGLDRGLQGVIDNRAYLECFGIDRAITFRELWCQATKSFAGKNLPIKDFITDFRWILENGNLAERITKAYHSSKDISLIYRQLCECLWKNEAFKI